MNLIAIGLAALGALPWSGNFSGVGSAFDFNGWDAPCTSVTASLEVTATRVKLRDASYECGAIAQKHDPISLERNASDELFLDGRRVGVYSDDEIDFVLPFAHVDGMSFVIRLLKSNDSVLFREDWISEQDGALDHTFEMSATLKPRVD